MLQEQELRFRVCSTAPGRSCQPRPYDCLSVFSGHALETRHADHATIAYTGNNLPFPLAGEHLPRVLELMQKYRDLPMDLADASLVILAEHLGGGRILSTDRRDFHAYRWKNRRPFQNLMDDHG